MAPNDAQQTTHQPGPECAHCGLTHGPCNGKCGVPVHQTTIEAAVSRAEFAARLADRLLMFPLAPQPGDTLEQHAAGLRVAYAHEILAALNEEVARG